MEWMSTLLRTSNFKVCLAFRLYPMSRPPEHRDGGLGAAIITGVVGALLFIAAGLAVAFALAGVRRDAPGAAAVNRRIAVRGSERGSQAAVLRRWGHGGFDEAIASFKKALLPARPSGVFREVHLFLASAYALKGETELAASELAQVRRFFRPDTFNITWIREHMMYRPEPGPPPAIRALDDRTYFAGLRKAGMPEK
jgi:hypothetical protein